ncbi:MAG: ATP-dependent Clp protease ATP-binding subunit, partial [Candidatus Kerfeldbacteria bacterium]|nr:ATP-dependent Clp protease ATP-binding subunit [Candidatus Kerfeldbacteria bacterium]
MTELSILERRLEHMVRALLSALLFVFTATGLYLGGRILVEAAGQGTAWEVLLQPSWPMATLWFGLLCGMFLVYRLERDITMTPKIPAPSGPPMTTDPAWSTVAFRDIAQVTNEAAIRVLEHAWRQAATERREQLSPLHVLWALSTTPEVASMLVRLMITPSELRQRLDKLIAEQTAGTSAPVLGQSAHQLLVNAFHLAASQGRVRLTPAFLFAAIGHIDDPARELLDALGVDQRKLDHATSWLIIQEDLRRRVRRYESQAATKPQGPVDRGYTAAATPTLDRYSIDLTLRASRGTLSYVIGREHELQAVYRVMESGRKSVILVGDTGVGKTHILYALAERMAAEDVPEILQDKRLVALQASSLVAGAGGIGQLEARLQDLIGEIVRSGNIILAIENIDQLVGVTSAGSGLDAAQIIAQELQQHAFLAIATAETGSYRQLLEH